MLGLPVSQPLGLWTDDMRGLSLGGLCLLVLI